VISKQGIVVSKHEIMISNLEIVISPLKFADFGGKRRNQDANLSLVQG